MKPIADIIMPGVTTTPELLEMARTAVSSCSDYAWDARIIFLDNGGKHTFEREKFGAQLTHAGHIYEFITEPFNEAAYFNYGADISAAQDPADIIFYANFDLVFHPNWLTNLIRLWEAHPEYACVAPHSASSVHQGLCYRTPDASPEERIVPCDHPSNWFYGIRRSEGYRHPEEFKYWHVDDNFHEWLKSTGRKAGVAYNSRVDHLADAVKKHDPSCFGFDLESHIKDADAAFREKWKK